MSPRLLTTAITRSSASLTFPAILRPLPALANALQFLSERATVYVSQIDRAARRLQSASRLNLYTSQSAALASGTMRTRLTISQSRIVNGQITQERTLDFTFPIITVPLDNPWCHLSWRRLAYARARLENFMATKVTVAKSPLLSILNELPGGWHTAFVILQHIAKRDGDSEEAKLMAAWEETHAVHGTKVTPEDIAQAAGMTPSRMLGIVVEAAHSMKVTTSKLIHALNLDDVMRRAVKEAKTKGGFKDRERVLAAAGLYPSTSQAISIYNNPTATAQAAAGIQAGVHAAEGLDEFERDTIDSTSFLREFDTDPARGQIESPAAFVQTITAEAVTDKLEVGPER
jgi:hypothetical protein